MSVIVAQTDGMGYNNMGDTSMGLEGFYAQTLQPGGYQARGTYIDSSQMSSVLSATQIAEQAYTSARQQGFKDTGRATTIDPSQVPLAVSAIPLGAGVGAWVPGGEYQPQLIAVDYSYSQQPQPAYTQVLSRFLSPPCPFLMRLCLLFCGSAFLCPPVTTWASTSLWTLYTWLKMKTQQDGSQQPVEQKRSYWDDKPYKPYVPNGVPLLEQGTSYGQNTGNQKSAPQPQYRANLKSFKQVVGAGAAPASPCVTVMTVREEVRALPIARVKRQETVVEQAFYDLHYIAASRNRSQHN